MSRKRRWAEIGRCLSKDEGVKEVVVARDINRNIAIFALEPGDLLPDYPTMNQWLELTPNEAEELKNLIEKAQSSR